MQTILGANGIIGRELSRNLLAYTNDIRQVSRHPKKVNANDETLPADLLNFDQTSLAVRGSDVVYLVAGLKYDTKTWVEQWPKVMRNTIDACKKHNSKLVFFDNVYAYGLVPGAMTEDTSFNPVSKKGEVRAKIATQLLDEIKNGNLNGMIVRAADFYGPGAQQSLIDINVIEKLKARKTTQWIGELSAIHTFTYTPDAGRTVAILGNTANAFNQTWHALTSKEKINGETLIKIASEVTGRPYRKPQTISKLGVRMLGIFIPVLREFVEMMYQFENEYIFDSTKFETRFGQTATSYREGIASCFDVEQKN